MHISVMIANNRMLCTKCRGHMIREEWFDLPGGIYEFFCLNCGERVWIRQDLLSKPIYTN
jgi:late competence protein required for DNA uptake (superfamily II DNA/RNA helicase)